MGFLFKLLLLPVTGPTSGFLAVLRKIQEEAEGQYSDPDFLRLQLSQLQGLLEAGEIDEDTYDTYEEIILDRLDAIYEGTL